MYSIYSRNRLTDWWQSLVRVGEVQDNSVLTGAFAGQFNSDQTQVTWQNDFTTSIGKFIAGIDYLRQTVGGTTAFAVDNREIYGVFAGYSTQIGRNTLFASVRNDDNSQFGNHTTGSLGYAFALTSELRLRASAGNAFHAPTFNDLYFPGFGNPNLQPEKGTSWEVGADYRIGAQKFSATYFDNHISQLIVTDRGDVLAHELELGDHQGLELGYDGVVRGFELRARLTVQDPVDDNTGDQLPRRAKIFGNAGIARSLGDFQRRCRARRRQLPLRLDRPTPSQRNGWLRSIQSARVLQAQPRLAGGLALEQRVQQELHTGTRLQHRGEQRVRVGQIRAAKMKQRSVGRSYSAALEHHNALSSP